MCYVILPLTVAQAVIDNLAFDVDAFHCEGIISKPLLFHCIDLESEDAALYLIKKGADVKNCVTKVSREVRFKHFF